MWHAMIRGSVSSSIRSSSDKNSDKNSPDDPPSSENATNDPSSFNHDCEVEPTDTNTSPPRPSTNHEKDKNLHDYNINKWMNNKTPVNYESSTTPTHSSEKTNISPATSSVRTLRASRSLLDIAASRPSSNLDRSFVLIGSGEQTNNNGDSMEDTDDDDDDDDDDDNNNNNASIGMIDMKNMDTAIGTMDSSNHQWNDKKHQRQATIITIPSRVARPMAMDAETIKKLSQQRPAIAPKPVPKEEEDDEKSTNEKSKTQKPKKKRRWENVSPPSSPTKKNYEVSLATIAAPPKRKTNGTELPRPHACHLCDRKFNRRYNLTAHIRVHDPDRKKLFDCPSCDQSFDRKHDRDRHADALHFEHKHRCYCHLCDASFTRRDALTRHVHKLHTPPQPDPSSSNPPPSTNP